MKKGPSTLAETPELALIQQIKAKQLSPTLLSVEDRRRCVEVLCILGYLQAEIALIFECTVRTIHRDREAIKASYALAPNPHLTARAIGYLEHIADTCTANLGRNGKDPAAKPQDKSITEYFRWKVGNEYFEKLQSVGYVPKVASTPAAQLYNNEAVNPIGSLESLVLEIEEFARQARESGQMSEEDLKDVDALLDEVKRGQLSAKFENLKQRLINKETVGEGTVQGCIPSEA